MPVTDQTIARCHDFLRRLARSGRRITYGELMTRFHIARQSIKECLNPIYDAEVSRANHPDLTLIPHYSRSHLGLYNSRGARPQTIIVRASDRAKVRMYKDDLKRVFDFWGGRPTGSLKKWLES
jgi:hypothetical protein